ncbi:hypothetical protein DRJ19_04345 [Candidatus Woesearchaeota archaeon]|nr:MAG: hypothetical protein DRJ19_04345 [Candidatus Woesearchaeota archaeon]
MRRELIEDFFGREITFTGVKRDLELDLRWDKVKNVIGPRRAGKTWYFFWLYNNLRDPMYINFEDIAFRDVTPEDFFKIIEIFTEIMYPPRTLLLDEVQVVENWDIMVRSLHDRRYNVFVTGSSSKLMPREISTRLRGRSLTYFLFPFSFREFLRARYGEVKYHSFEERGKILQYLQEYIKYGGFPEVVLSENKDRILREYFNEIFYRDFVERHKIKSLNFGRFLFEFAFQNFSSEISIRKIKRFFGRNISDTTLYNYVDALEDTLVVFFLDRLSKKVYMRKSWPRKIYVCDVGISSILSFTENIGKKMENILFIELMRRKNVHPLREIYYWREISEGEKEVDFVIKERDAILQLIQVTYATDMDEIDRREISALIKASDLLRCKNLVVITWALEDELEIKGYKIKFIPLWKYLLLS